MRDDEVTISRLIIESYSQKLQAALESDVAIAGAGPAGMTAACCLARAGLKVVVCERKLAVGGGVWGGGMMFNQVVLEESAKHITDEVGVRTTACQDDLYLADALELASALCLSALKAGATILNLTAVEDIMVKEGKVTGLVINWSAVEQAKLHVDPLTLQSRIIIDATGHDAAVANMLVKHKLKLVTSTGALLGQGAMWARQSEEFVVEHTGEIYPDVYAVGMSVSAVFGGPRMGPIFGGMLLSGEKAAHLIIEKLKSRKE